MKCLATTDNSWQSIGIVIIRWLWLGFGLEFGLRLGIGFEVGAEVEVANWNFVLVVSFMICRGNGEMISEFKKKHKCFYKYNQCLLFMQLLRFWIYLILIYIPGFFQRKLTVIPLTISCYMPCPNLKVNPFKHHQTGIPFQRKQKTPHCHHLEKLTIRSTFKLINITTFLYWVEDEDKSHLN